MNTIIVRNLTAKACTEANLTKYFSAVGPISTVTADHATKSACIAFRNSTDVEKAILKNGSWLLGSSLQIERANQQVSRKRSRSNSRSISPNKRRRSVSKSPPNRIGRERGYSPPTRRISRSRSRSASPARRRSVSRSPRRPRRTDRSPPTRLRSRSRSRSVSFSPPRRPRPTDRSPTRLRSRSRSPSVSCSPPRRRDFSRSIDRTNRSSERRSGDLDAVLTDLLDGTTEELIRNAVMENMTDPVETFDSSNIESIKIDSATNKALITFREIRFVKKFLEVKNLMLFGRVIPIQNSLAWDYRSFEWSEDETTKQLKFRRTDRKALESLIDPAVLKYVTDTLGCTIVEHAIEVRILFQGPDRKTLSQAYSACLDSGVPSRNQ